MSPSGRYSASTARGFAPKEVVRGYTLQDIDACTEMGYIVSAVMKLDAHGPGQED